jgi:hypothetical protein
MNIVPSLSNPASTSTRPFSTQIRDIGPDHDIPQFQPPAQVSLTGARANWLSSGDNEATNHTEAKTTVTGLSKLFPDFLQLESWERHGRHAGQRAPTDTARKDFHRQ